MEHRLFLPFGNIELDMISSVSVRSSYERSSREEVILMVGGLNNSRIKKSLTSECKIINKMKE